ncbi:MAG TPA: orotidine 5'-phosphate decarboxylase / HUMPS family protein [Microlunatus sp.]|nr:orotidine 5'-phosphate decarboxylase / HUMPS family protein [Microlunatus sp.]
MMQLQIALDRLPAAEAVRIAADIAPFADVIEVGTSLIKAFGMPIVRRIASVGDGTPVLADLKTADDARTEFELAYDAGARSATVLGLAALPTVHTCVAVAAERDLEVVVDLMELTPDRSAVLSAELPHEAVLAAHVPKDAQNGGAQAADLVGSWARGRRLAVAGGLGLGDVPRLARLEEELELEWLRIIVGSAVTKAPDVRSAAEQLAQAVGRTVEVTR